MIKTCFILLTIITAGMLIACASYVSRRAYTRLREQKRFTLRITVVIILWLLYVSLLSLNDVFTKATFPPRVPLLLVLPAFASFVYFFSATRYRKVIAATPLSLPVYFQSFRIGVELLLLALSLNSILPVAATFEGYNYDILIGLSAPLVAFYLLARGKEKRGFVFIWNIAGLATLLVVVVILITYAYFPALWGVKEGILAKGFGLFPYTYLAGFLMPVAVFMHALSMVTCKR